MQNTNELVIIVDKEDKYLGSCERSLVRKTKQIHRGAYVYIFDKEMNLYVQKRAEDKSWCPGYWQIQVYYLNSFWGQHSLTILNLYLIRDLSFGGVVQYSETYQTCAERELQEELGIHIKLQEIGKFYFECENNWLWGCVFIGYYEGDLIVQKEEIQEVVKMNLKEISKKICNGELFAPNSNKGFELLLKECKELRQYQVLFNC